MSYKPYVFICYHFLCSAVLAAANYVSTLDQKGHLTLLAPTNAAFQSMNVGLREKLLNGDRACLESKLLLRLAVSYPVLSHFVLPSLLLSCHILLCLVLPCVVLPCLVLPCFVLSGLVMSCLVYPLS